LGSTAGMTNVVHAIVVQFYCNRHTALVSCRTAGRFHAAYILAARAAPLRV